MDIIAENIKTPYHVVDIDRVIANISVIETLKKHSGCKVLFALKCYPNDSIFPYINNALDGVCASGLFEARLGKECFGKEVHTFSSGISGSNIGEISKYSDSIAFNSNSQLKSFGDISKKLGCTVGIRINPEYSEIFNYNINPCHEFARFGMTKAELDKVDMRGVEFILIHNMCSQFTATFRRSVESIVSRFDAYLKIVKYINLGGGQLFTHESYKIDEAITILVELQKKYGIPVYLEPGEAIMYNTSYLVTSVVDIVDNGVKTAILDASAICHMPDVVFSKYPCQVLNGLPVGETKHEYRLAGHSCYAGDIFGDYSFREPLQIGDKVVFKDSLNYTAVKSSMFNGINYPSIVHYSPLVGHKIVKEYNYETYLSII
jgi:carboxynorspermidine decarboxylase